MRNEGEEREEKKHYKRVEKRRKEFEGESGRSPLKGVKIKIEKVKKVEAGSEEKEKMMIMRFENEGMRRDIKNKWRLIGKEIWIKDLT
ncbi:hypothetical protein P5V15_014068 [Pogonomyrmex californicus]